MALQCTARFQYLVTPLMSEKVWPVSRVNLAQSCNVFSVHGRDTCFGVSMSKPVAVPSLLYGRGLRRWRHGGIRNGAKEALSDDEDGLMDEEERCEWRNKIREVIDKYPDVQEEMDPEEKRRKMPKLLAEYPFVVEEEDPDWPEDADGRGFKLDQFFDKITIKNVKKDNDDEDYDSDKEIVWQDDDYIRPIKDITSVEWEETVFKDISPLIVLVHNRYKRPKENERCWDELERAVNIIWNCRLPSPRCVAIDAVVDCDLASELKVSVFPELIFTKAGKILYREKGQQSHPSSTLKTTVKRQFHQPRSLLNNNEKDCCEGKHCPTMANYASDS